MVHPVTVRNVPANEGYPRSTAHPVTKGIVPVNEWVSGVTARTRSRQTVPEHETRYNIIDKPKTIYI